MLGNLGVTLQAECTIEEFQHDDEDIFYFIIFEGRARFVFFSYFLLKFSCSTVLVATVLVSFVQQNESAIRIPALFGFAFPSRSPRSIE